MGVTCSDCGERLPDDAMSDPATRVPCPKCGSIARSVHVLGELRAVLGGLALHATGTVSPGPSLLLQAVVTLGERVEDGRLIEAVAPAWREIARLLRDDPSLMYRIDPILFQADYDSAVANLALRPKARWMGRFTRPRMQRKVRNYLNCVQVFSPGATPLIVVMRHQGIECNSRYDGGGVAEDKRQTILVCSPQPDDGKSFCYACYTGNYPTADELIQLEDVLVNRR